MDKKKCLIQRDTCRNFTVTQLNPVSHTANLSLVVSRITVVKLRITRGVHGDYSAHDLNDLGGIGVRNSKLETLDLSSLSINMVNGFLSSPNFF